MLKNKKASPPQVCFFAPLSLRKESGKSPTAPAVKRILRQRRDKRNVFM
jgi:hypothetical protein